jgi:hypothetical protein
MQMSDNNPTKSGLKELKEEVQTKGLYVGLALLFVANAAGVFAASIPSIIFVALFLVAVGIDAYT